MLLTHLLTDSSFILPLWRGDRIKWEKACFRSHMTRESKFAKALHEALVSRLMTLPPNLKPLGNDQTQTFM